MKDQQTLITTNKIKPKQINNLALIEELDDIEYRTLLVEQQYEQIKVLAIKEQLASLDTVQVNLDLKLNELEMLETEQHLWLTDQLLQRESYQSKRPETQVQLNLQAELVDIKPTAMVSSSSYLF